MKKLSVLILLAGTFIISGCHHWHNHGNGNGKGQHCPPGQEKKGNC